MMGGMNERTGERVRQYKNILTVQKNRSGYW